MQVLRDVSADDAEYGGAVAIVDAVVESSLHSAQAASGSRQADGFAVGMPVRFIEVGPISVGVERSLDAWPHGGADSQRRFADFRDPEAPQGRSYGALRSAAGDTGIEKLGL